MRFELTDIKACETVDDIKNLEAISETAFARLTHYANRLMLEASTALQDLYRIEKSGTVLDGELLVAKNVFTEQQKQMKLFFDLARKAGAIKPIPSKPSKSRLIGLICEEIEKME